MAHRKKSVTSDIAKHLKTRDLANLHVADFFGRAIEASSIATMKSLIERDPRNQEKIFPYVGGEDINSNPLHQSDRFVINLSGLTEEEASRWPNLMDVCRQKVRPHRIGLRVKDDAKLLREKWWWYGRQGKELYAKISQMPQVIGCSQTSKYLSFALLPARTVFSHKTRIVALDSFSDFGVLQSRVHQEWAYFRGSTMKDDPVYTPSDCFRTFPFPASSSALCDHGELYHEHRRRVMVANDEGLTTTYNRLHDPHEKSAEIQQLRELHDAMDRAVLEAYGWDDLAKTATCEFLLDYEEEEDEEETGKKSRRKKPWRLRWPDDFRDEVLARLLELNEKRAEEERLAGAKTEAKKPKRKAKAKKSTQKETLF